MGIAFAAAGAYAKRAFCCRKERQVTSEMVMKLVSKFAFALTLGTLFMSPTAYAKEKKEDAKKAPPKPKLSAEFKKVYGPVVGAYTASLASKAEAAKAKSPEEKAKFEAERAASLATAEAGWPAVKASIASDDDKYEAGIFANSLAVELQQVSYQKEAMELLLASALTPASDKPLYNYQMGLFAYDAKDYASAQKILTDSYAAGFRGNNIETHLSNIYSAQGNNAEALSWLKNAVEANKAAAKPVDSKLLARGMNLAMKLNSAADVSYWGKEFIKVDQSAEAYHDAIFQFDRFGNLNEQETLDLLRLARLKGALLFQQEYTQYLQVVDQKRYPAEALAVIKEGTDKGIISDKNVTFAEIKKEAVAALAEVTSNRTDDEKAAAAATKGYPALLTGDAALSLGDFAKAKELYELALTKGSITDNQNVDQTDRLLMHLAIAKGNLGDWTGAKADLQKLTGTNRKAVAEYWTIYIDQQNK